MQSANASRLAAAGAAALAGAAHAAADEPKVDPAKVDQAFETLKTYDWGADRNLLDPIDRAVIATRGDAAARQELEARLVAVLKGGASRSAKDFVCRALRTVGTAESVPALAALLPNAELSHMARYALERTAAPEAGTALRDALPRVKGDLKVGVIGSLGVRGDAASVASLAALLGDGDCAVSCAAAHALGLIGSPEAGKALAAFVEKAPQEARVAATDACLVCADRLLAAGEKADAIALYKSLGGDDQPKHVRVAATRGMLEAAGGKK